MADYYQLVARAVAGLDKNTGESRRALYKQLRKVLLAQLRALDPPLTESQITREVQSLEDAISKVEAAARLPVDFPAENKGGLSSRIRRGSDTDVPGYVVPAATAGHWRGPSEFKKGLAMGTVVYAIGRIAIVVTFIVSGVLRLLDIGSTGNLIASKVLPWPDPLAGAVASIEATVGLPFTQILAIASPALEIVVGLLIAIGIFTRSAALVLLVLTAMNIYYFHNLSDLQGTDQMIRAVNELSIMGALLILVAPRPHVLGAGDDNLGSIPGEDLTSILRRLNSDQRVTGSS